VRQILWITRHCPWPPIDGARRLSLSGLTSLAALGLDTTTLVIAPDAPAGRMPIREATRSGIHHLAFIPRTGLREIMKGLFSDLPVNIAKHDSSHLAGALPRAIAETAWDLIVLDTFHLSTWLPSLRQTFPERPIILRQHNLEWRILQGHAGYQPDPARRMLLRWQARKLKRLELRTIPRFDACVCISDIENRLLRGLLPPQCLVTIPCSVDCSERFRPQEKRYDLCFVGRLDWYPNRQGLLWFLERVYPKLRQSLPAVSFAVIGMKGDFPTSRYETGQVRFTGVLDDIGPAVASCRLFVNPVFYGGGMRIKTLDAMAIGIPVVSTPKGVEALGVERGSHYIEAKTEAEFTDAITTAIRQPTVTDAVADRARAYVCRRFGSAAVTKGWKSLLDRLVRE
jgi:glycosyltransferase involved in cell wall biosynthesis